MYQKDRQASRVSWPPEPGYFRVPLVKNGWPLPAKIEFTDGLWQATLDGRPGWAHADPGLAEHVAWIWQGGGDFSDEEEYYWRLAKKASSLAHEPQHPSLHPRRPMDHRLLRPL